MGLIYSLIYITTHPLNRGNTAAALIRWLRWQLGSRLLPGPVLLHFVGDVGSYTLLAGGGAGARVVAVKPIPNTFSWLMRNIALNSLEHLVAALNIGLGRAEGRLRFTRGHDTTNHVLAEGEYAKEALEVPVHTLDAVLDGRSPTLIKIDVEVFETEVLAGADRSLTDPNLLAVILELNGSGTRYGFDEETLHPDLLVRGFETYRYRPFERELAPLHGARSEGGNTLYARDAERLSDRARTTAQFRSGTGAEI